MPRLTSILMALVMAFAAASCSAPIADDATTVTTAQAAPDFTLPTASGQAISLSDRLAEGPVVLVFYRGHW